MSKLFLKNGTEITVEDFQPNESNLIKVRLHNNDEDVEGIWACLNDEIFKQYQDNSHTSDYEYYATLRNDAVGFYPRKSWGMIIPIKFNGSERPDCNIDIIDFDKTQKENSGELLFNLLNTQNNVNDEKNE